MKKFLIVALLLFLFSANAQAAKIDVYRTFLLKNSYTIRYENITPPPRITNADRVELYGKSGLAVEGNDYLLNKPKHGIITCDNNDKYEEVGEGDFYLCRLSKIFSTPNTNVATIGNISVRRKIELRLIQRIIWRNWWRAKVTVILICRAF